MDALFACHVGDGAHHRNGADGEDFVDARAVVDELAKLVGDEALVAVAAVVGGDEDGVILFVKEYDVDNTWTDYIQNLIPIMNQFIESYKGNVDVDFWNKIMNFEYGRGGSGSVDYVSGWILNFFGLKGKIDDDDIPNYNFDVPVTILNYLTNTKKVVNIIGGFSGIYNDNNSYRPQLSYAVYHDGNTKSL